MSVSINGSTGLTFNDGTVQNTVGYSPWRNRIINGGFDVWQRGTSGTVAAGGFGYAADRFYIYTLGGSTAYSLASGLAIGSSLVNTNAILMSGSAGNTALNFGQRIEAVNIRDRALSQVTFSGWLYSSVTVTPTLYGFTPNSVDNHSSVTSVGTLPALPTVQANTWTYFSVAFTLPAAAANGLDIGIQWGATGAVVNRYVANLQLEAGTTATPFERVEYGEMLRRCQRYYAAVNGIAVNANLFVALQWPVAMRSSPTATSTVSSVSVQSNTAGYLQNNVTTSFNYTVSAEL